jgi:hypothetical protein
VPFETINHCPDGVSASRLPKWGTLMPDTETAFHIVFLEICFNFSSALHMFHCDKPSIPSLKTAYAARLSGFLNVEGLTLDIGAPFII